MTELKRIESYYKKASEGIVETEIEESLRNDPKEVVYGAQSVNVRMPPYLQKFTEDFDIYSLSPQETAAEIEKILDKTFGGDYFEVRPAKHEGTFKVISKVTQREVADITLLDKTVKYQVIDGINYATLDEQVTNIKKSLTDRASKFRWNKDKETLQRIRLYKSRHRGKEPTIKELQALEADQTKELGEDERMEQEILGSLTPKRRSKEARPSLTTVRMERRQCTRSIKDVK